MSYPRILVAGVGNIFLGDDAFGVEVVQRLARRRLPPEVRVVDFGIRGYDLTCALLDGYETVILVDAVPRGGWPGTLYVIEPEAAAAVSPPGVPLLDPHSLDPAQVLRLATTLGSPVRRVLLVGCEPAPADDADLEMSDGLSAPVAAALDEAVSLVESLIAQSLVHEQEPCSSNSC